MGTKSKESWKKAGPNVVEGTKDMILLPGSEEEDHDHGEEDHHHELDLIRGFHPKWQLRKFQISRIS